MINPQSGSMNVGQQVGGKGYSDTSAVLAVNYNF